MHKKILISLLILIGAMAEAQTSNVTATITDPDGQTWNNGTYLINFIPTPGIPPGNFSWQGNPNFQKQFSGAISGGGSFSVSIPDNSFISPAGSQWQFTLCSNTSAACQNVTLGVAGSGPNLSTALSSHISAPRFQAGQYAFGYLDIEVVSPNLGQPLSPGVTYWNVSGNVTRQWTGSAWQNLSGGGGGGSPGNPVNTLQANIGNSFTATSNSFFPNAGTFNQQTGNIGIDLLNSIPFPNGDYNWQQSPTSPSSITAGANTVTLPIGPAGLYAVNLTGFTPFQTLYLAGTGTPEVVTITATNCPLNGTSAACTVTFTAANNHAAGYTLGSATGGIEEAIVSTQAGFGPAHVIVPPGNYSILGKISYPFHGVTVDYAGATLTHNALTCASMMVLGDPNHSTFAYDNTVENLTVKAGVNNCNAPAIENNSGHSRIIGMNTVAATGNLTSGPSFGSLIQVDNDQAAVIDRLDTNGGRWAHCASDFCSTAVTGISGGGNSSVIYVSHSQISLNCTGNGIDQESGNTLHVSDTVVQGQVQFAIRAHAAFAVNPAVQLSNVYFEPGNCTNPLYGLRGNAGLIVLGGRAEVTGGTQPTAFYPQFTNTGSTQVNFFVVINSSTAGPSGPLFIGQALTNGSGNVNVLWPDQGSSGTLTYDLLATTGTTGALVPHDTGNYAVQTGVSHSNCTAGLCTLTINIANAIAPTSYTVQRSTYSPALNFWPGSVILSQATDSQNNGGEIDTFYRAFEDADFITTSAQWGYTQAYIDRCNANSGSLSNAILNCANGSSNGNNNQAVVGTVIQSNGGGVGGQGLSGRTEYYWPSSLNGPTDIITLGSGAQGTMLADGNQRPVFNAADTAIGQDSNSNNVPPASFQLSLRSPLAISEYINHIPDNSSWLERLTSSAKTFKVPVTAATFNATTGYQINGSYGTSGNCLLSTGSGSQFAPCPGGGGGGVSSVSAGGLSPLFTTSVATPTTTPAITFTQTAVSNNQIFGNVSGNTANPTFFSPSITSSLFANAGTATTVLHGNAAGNLTFGAVSLTTDVSGNLPVTNLNGGTGASSSTFWRGDGTWQPTAGGSPAWSTITNPVGNLALTMGTNLTTFTAGDFGVSPANTFTWTDSATSTTDTSVNGYFNTGASSHHTPFAAAIQGTNQLQVCWQAGPQGEVVFGSVVTCPNINQSPFAKVVEMSGTAAHNILRLFQSNAAATGTMLEMNNATAAGSGFYFFKANTGCTNGDTSCGAGATTSSLQGNGTLLIQNLTLPTFGQGKELAAGAGGVVYASNEGGVDCAAPGFQAAGDMSQAILACEAAYPTAGMYDATGFTGAQTWSRNPWTAGTTTGQLRLGCNVTITDTFGSIALPTKLALVGCQEDGATGSTNVATNGTLIVAGTGFPVTGGYNGGAGLGINPLFCYSGDGTNLDANTGCATATTAGNFQSPVSNITLSCANKATCVPYANNNAQEGSDVYRVKGRNYQTYGLMVANPDGSACTHCQNFKMSEMYSQEQGDFCTVNTHALYVNATGGDVTIEKGSYNYTNCVTNIPADVVRVSGQAVKLDTPHIESGGLSVANALVIGQDSPSSSIEVINGFLTNLGASTCVNINNTNPVSYVTLIGIQCGTSGATNLINDQVNPQTGTITLAAEPNIGFYATGRNGYNTVLANFNLVNPTPTAITNAGSTGTTLNKLAKLTGAPSTAVITATADTAGIIGIVIGNAGTTGKAQVAQGGQAPCVYDGTTTAGDFVVNSSTVAGDCHDAGSARPTTGDVIGRVLSTNAGAGTYNTLVYGPDVVAASGGGGGGGNVSTSPSVLTSGTIPVATGQNTIANSSLSDNTTTLSYAGAGGVAAQSFTSTGNTTGAVILNEGAAVTGQQFFDVLFADSTSHWLRMNNNNVSSADIVAGITGTPVVNHIPKFNSAFDITDGFATQGTDSKLLTVASVGSAGSVFCADANGGATTTGCGGTVVSVGLQVNTASSSGIFTIGNSPIQSSGNLNITLSGNNTGIPYFSSGTVLSSGPAITTNSPILGGASGPQTIAGITSDGISKLTLGVAGSSVGAVAMNNATSGTLTLQPATGALGTVTATLPANTGTIGELNLAQTWSALQTFNAASIGSNAHGPLISEGAGSAVAASAGAVGNVFIGNGATSDPSFASLSNNALTYNAGGNTTWPVGNIPFATASVTLTGASTTLHVTNPVNGGVYQLAVTQDATGSRTMSLGTAAGECPAWKVINQGGTTSVSLTSTASKTDYLIFGFDGSTCNMVANLSSTGSGSVSQVGFSVNSGSSSGIFAVTGSPVTTTGTLNMNLSGTSGGIPYFSSGTVVSSSAALAANQPVVGGGAGTAPSTISLAFATLTDAATVTFPAANAWVASAKVTLGGNRTLSPTGLVNGGQYTLEIFQDATGSRTLALGTGGSCTAWKVANGGGGAITLSTAANALDVLSFTFDGTNCLATFAKNFN